MFHGNNLPNDARVAIPRLYLWGAPWARYADKSEVRKNGSGKERTGKWENEANGTARRMSPLRARWRYVAGPGCRTFRSGRNEGM